MTAREDDSFVSTPPEFNFLTLIPEGAQYDLLRASVGILQDFFPDQYETLTPDRVQAWVDELASGTGRTASDLRSDIFEFVVGTEEIQDAFGVSEDEADQLITGTMTFSELGAKAAGAGTDRIGKTVIPEGATLVKVNNPTGSDATALYYLTYEWKGVTYSFEVGDSERLNELFGGESRFDEKKTMNQTRFDGAGYVIAGSADPLLGADESFTALMDRETKAAGMEDLPAWIEDSTDALGILSQGAALGWTTGRIWDELAKTDAFTERFGATIDLYRREGTNVQDAVQQILADEGSIAKVVRFYGEPGADYDSDYLQRALAGGWTAQSAAQVLEATNQLTRNPTALRDANAVLIASGLAPVDEAGFINIMLGGAPDDVTEAINTANADRALRDAGLDDVDMKLLLGIVDTTDRVLTVDSFRTIASELASNFARFSTELDREAFGIGEDEVTAALFGRESPSGRSAGDVLNTLARFQRDRQAASRGVAGNVGFVDQSGNLRFQGV